MKIVATLLLLGALTSCTTDLVRISQEEVAKPALDIPSQTELELRPVDWYVITPDNVDEHFRNLIENDIDPVIIGLTDEGYENLSLNFADLRYLILLNQKILEQYQRYYEGTQDANE